MQINLPDDTAFLIREKALAAGFGDRLEAYVTYLISMDEPQSDVDPRELSQSMAGRSQREIAAMIEAGFASGPASSWAVEIGNSSTRASTSSRQPLSNLLAKNRA